MTTDKLIKELGEARSMLNTVAECASHACDDCREFAAKHRDSIDALLRQEEDEMAKLLEWQRRACNVLPLIPRDHGSDLAREVGELLRTETSAVTAREKLAKVEQRLKDAGVKDVKFAWAENVKDFTLTKVTNDVSTALTAFLDGNVRPLPPFNDGTPNKPVELKAKKLYTAHTDNDPIIHSNRFPSWEELSTNDKQLWIDRVNARDTP